jgi:acetyl-CoA carboxylase biotin carboxyl carrier protein
MTPMPTDDRDIDTVRLLMDEFVRSGLATLHLRAGGFELLLSNDPSAPSLSVTTQAQAAPVSALATAAPPRAARAPVAVATLTPVPAALPENAVVIAAPNLGTFYRAPKPGAAAYVEIGARVGRDDEICLIEVMKLFTAVKAGQAGTIIAVLAEDGAMVEAGQPLFALVAG